MDNLSLLKSVGFTEYGARAYLALSELGPSTVNEIAYHSKLPRNKAYEILSRLESEGRIASLPVTPRKYKIVDTGSLKKDIQEKKKRLNQLEKDVDRFIQESARPRLNEFREIVWIIRGKKGIIDKMNSQNRKSRQEIISLNRLSVASPKLLKDMQSCISRGVKVKMLVPPGNIKNRELWVKTGVEIRTYDEKIFGAVGTRFSVFDKSIARITFGEPDVLKEEDYITIWAESHHLANILRGYFFEIWRKSN
ncbi:MAG: TrmB family transcriptional regulator [Nanoarchaeota archaeon]|nr:TrmB family transcriptional regulator [Nanoarchaeota archaeon]